MTEAPPSIAARLDQSPDGIPMLVRLVAHELHPEWEPSREDLPDGAYAWVSTTAKVLAALAYQLHELSVWNEEHPSKITASEVPVIIGPPPAPRWSDVATWLVKARGEGIMPGHEQVADPTQGATPSPETAA